MLINMIVILDLKVITKARHMKIDMDKPGLLTVYIKSLPIEGKANKEVVKLFSKLLKVPQLNIEIISGLQSKYKKIKIETLDLSVEQVLNRLITNSLK